MTTSALCTMITAWAIITFLMLKFLIRVIRTPQEKDSTEEPAREPDREPARQGEVR
jgi:hypothetical protein